jgi:hypothetical protein
MIWRGFVALCAIVASATACHRSTIAHTLGDQDFWQLIETLSEPPGTFSISDNLVSNEPHVTDNARRLSTTGGVYIGVGPEQNFTYIARLRPAMAFIVDIRRENRDLHLLYKALFEISPDRTEFVSRLFSRPRPANLGRRASAAEIFKGYATVSPSPELLNQTLTLVRDRLLTTHRFPVSPDEIESMTRALKAFYADGPEIRFYRSAEVRAVQPTYRQLMTMRDGYGQEWSFLSDEDAFETVKDLHLRNMIVPIVGDFGGPTALRRVGDYVRQRSDVVQAFYGSNVQVYLTNRQAYAFCGNLAALPAASATYFIERDSVRTLASRLKDCRTDLR